MFCFQILKMVVLVKDHLPGFSKRGDFAVTDGRIFPLVPKNKAETTAVSGSEPKRTQSNQFS